MAFLDKFKHGKGQRPEGGDENLPVLGREEASGQDAEGARPIQEEEASVYEQELNKELPSVNRRRSGNNLVNNLGYVVILLGGLGMLYLVSGDDRDAAKKPPAKPQKLTNSLPPLNMPVPVPPEPLALQVGPAPTPTGQVVPAIDGTAQPIPLQAAAADKPKSKEQDWLERKMSGAMMIKGSGEASAKPVMARQEADEDAAAGGHMTPLGSQLQPTITKPASAKLLPNRNFIIAKGTSLDCALETAIDSTVPGLTTCRLTRDIYSDNGHVVLLDRGSQLVGEYQGGITAGQVRIFVVWTRVKTPNGVVIALDSPGADALGRSGHEGWVDTHFMERFGAAILMSLVKDTIAYARAEQSKNGAVVIQGGDSTTDRMAVEMLKNTVKIPPTLYINQGDHIQIMVARDLNFASVYGLELKP